MQQTFDRSTSTKASPNARPHADDWHRRDVAGTLSILGSERTGLSEEAARARQDQYGPNELIEKGAKSPLTILWEQFSNVMVLILIAAAGLSLFLGKFLEAGAILAIVVLFAVFGFLQEYRAEKAIAALKKLAVPNVRAFRNGKLVWWHSTPRWACFWGFSHSPRRICCCVWVAGWRSLSPSSLRSLPFVVAGQCTGPRFRRSAAAGQSGPLSGLSPARHTQPWLACSCSPVPYRQGVSTMNTTIWTGLALTLLGVGSLIAAEATLTAATVAMLGLALIVLGVLMRQVEREQVAGAVALGVVLIGLLTALNTFGRTLSEEGLALSQPIVISVATAAICSLYLALWNWEHPGQRRDERPR